MWGNETRHLPWLATSAFQIGIKSVHSIGARAQSSATHFSIRNIGGMKSKAYCWYPSNNRKVTVALTRHLSSTFPRASNSHLGQSSSPHYNTISKAAPVSSALYTVLYISLIYHVFWKHLKHKMCLVKKDESHVWVVGLLQDRLSAMKCYQWPSSDMCHSAHPVLCSRILYGEFRTQGRAAFWHCTRVRGLPHHL